MKKIISVLICFVICFCGVNFVFSETGKEHRKVIRVPDYNMEGFIYVDEIGVRSGCSYEVFQEIAKYTGWTYEYVKCDRSQCIDMLEKGELDIVDTCIYSEKRKEQVKFSNITAGSGYKAVIANAGNENINPNDFENYNGIKIGIVDEPFWENSINEISKEKGFAPQVVKFKTYSEKFSALRNGEIDAVLTMSIQKTKKDKVLFEFDTTPYYFAVNKNNSQIMDQLDNAMQQIWTNDSAYFSRVYNKYYENASNNVFFLTEKEKEFVKNHKVIKAMATNNRAPLSSFNGDQYEGIVADIMNKAAAKAGFQFEFIKSPSYKEVFKSLRQGDVSVVCNFFYDYSWAEKNGVKMTDPYLEMQYTAVTNKDTASKQEKDFKVAYVNNYFFNEKFLMPKFDKSQLCKYDTEKDCIEAVDKGEADITFVSLYVAEKIIRDNNYYNISTSIYPEFKHFICTAVGNNEDIELLTILNKAIKSIDSSEITYIVNNHTLFKTENISLKTFVERNSWFIIIALIVIFVIGIVIVVCIFKMKRKYDQNIFNLAYVDKVTGIWNVNRFISEAKKKVESNDFKKTQYVLISFDISKFRIINEHYGRFAGDRVLKYVADMVTKEMPYGSIIARVNVDNFVMLAPFDNNDKENEFFKSIREKIRYYEEGGVALKLNFQCGVYIITNGNVSIDKALDMADIARKEARSSRKDKIVFFDKKMEDKIIRYKEIEERMETALEEREFVVYYQPKVDMKNEHIIGAEALVRWISKEKGFMNPGEFIPIFEKEGFIIELDFYVLEEVFKIIKEWITNGKNPIPISVNQSRVHLSNPYYIERLKNLIRKYKVPTKYIELELTESLFMEMDSALETVNKIKELGFAVSVDDFGSGFSSLNMLKSMPIDVVKIDREFLNESENSEKAQKIICKIVEMAKDLDMNVICEGVEKVEQATFLKSIGCYYAQGFLYAKPMPEPEFRDKVKSVIEKDDDTEGMI